MQEKIDLLFRCDRDDLKLAILMDQIVVNKDCFFIPEILFDQGGAVGMVAAVADVKGRLSRLTRQSRLNRLLNGNRGTGGADLGRPYMGLESRVPLMIVVHSSLSYCRALTPCTSRRPTR